MGLLRSLMVSNLDRRLENIYVQIYQGMIGMSPSEARAQFHRQLEWAKREIDRGGEYVAPEWFGSRLINNRRRDPKIGAYLTKLAAEGVRDRDVIWFWDMHNLDRVMMMFMFTLCVGACWNSHSENGLSPEQAGFETRKIHPLYGNPDDTSIAGGEDRPVPVELKDRVDIYIEKRAKE